MLEEVFGFLCAHFPGMFRLNVRGPEAFFKVSF